MNRRRALLGGGDKGLYIYKAGFTAWENVESVTTSVSPTITFGTNSVVITASSKNTGSRVNLLINEATYKKYTKLVVKMNGSGSSSSSIIWTTSTVAGVPADEIKHTISSGTKEYSFDIAGDTGNRYLCFYPYSKNAVYTIYDVHFE